MLLRLKTFRMRAMRRDPRLKVSQLQLKEVIIMKLIVFVDKNWTIGCDKKLLALIKGDLAYFKEKT